MLWPVLLMESQVRDEKHTRELRHRLLLRSHLPVVIFLGRHLKDCNDGDGRD